MRLAELAIADPPGRWEALGFTVRDGSCELGGVCVRLGGEGHGITSWALADGDDRITEIDGLPTGVARRRQAEPTPHANGVTGLDHVVVVTPDFDRTAAALEAAGLPLRRVRDAGGFRQGFRRLGPAILELVEAKDAPEGPARFWGLVPIVADIDALKHRLADLLSDPKAAVQPGRRIATLSRDAGLTPHVAFITPDPAT